MLRKDEAATVRAKLRVLFRMAAISWTALEQWCSYIRLYVLWRGKPSRKSRAEWLQRCCRATLRRIGVNYSFEGIPLSAGMMVSNHVSYLDIFVISALVPCVFVAKKEIEHWPLFGMMSCFAGTVFVDRERIADINRAGSELQEVLAGGVVAVLFPEGTSSDGSEVLPFRSPFFEFAGGSGAHLMPAHISYGLDYGDVGREVAYWGDMTLGSHVVNLFSKKHISAKVVFGESVEAGADRKRTAVLMRELVMQLGVRSQKVIPSVR